MKPVRIFPIFLIIFGILLLLDTTHLMRIGLDYIVPISMIFIGIVKIVNGLLE